MDKKLQKLFKEGKLTEQELEKAVAKGWISKEQKEAITAVKK